MYFLTVVEVGKSKMTTALAPPDGDPLSHFQTAAFCGWVLTWPFLKACGRTHTQRSPPSHNATSSSWIKTSLLSPHLILCSVTQSCLTLCDLMDCNPSGSSVHGILQARILEWVAVPFSRGYSQPRDEHGSPALQADSLPSEPEGKPNFCTVCS